MGKRDKKAKKCKKEKTKKARSSSTSSSSSSADEWVEKAAVVKAAERDVWMSLPASFATVSNVNRRQEREAARRKEKADNQYDPRLSARELNPYWKGGGDGLPASTKPVQFRKPSEEPDVARHKRTCRRSNWRKPLDSSSTDQYETLVFKSDSPPLDEPQGTAAVQPEHGDALTDKEMNDIAARIIKAEILGNTGQIEELTGRLTRARAVRSNVAEQPGDESVLLVRTDAKGFTQPLHGPPPAAKRQTKQRHQRVDTHEAGHRLRYFADDDKYSLKQMFEHEKSGRAAEQQDAEFLKLVAKGSDDLDDVFVDRIRTAPAPDAGQRRDRARAVHEHRSLDGCQQCIQSVSMPKHLMVSLGATVYLSLPPHEPLTAGHCLLIPHRHVPCATQLDEDEWAEVGEFRRALTRMFQARDEHAIFYETVLNSHAYSHMVIHCVPVARAHGDLAPIYFRKAIDECESEWTANRKLIELAGRDVRRAVPQGLPYFFVSFGMHEGFAHVIEDQRDFPRYFAAEVIGGMLDLHHSQWRSPRPEKFERQRARVLHFAHTWKQFDCTGDKQQ